MRCTPHEIHGILDGHPRIKILRLVLAVRCRLARVFLSLEDGSIPEIFLDVLIHGRQEDHVLGLVADKLLLRPCAPGRLVALIKLTLKADVVVNLILGLAQEHVISQGGLLTLCPMAGVVEGWILEHWLLIPVLAVVSQGTLWQVAGIVEVRNQVVLLLVPALAIVPVELLRIDREVLTILAQVDLCLEVDIVDVEFLGIHPQLEVLTIVGQVILYLEVVVVGQTQCRQGQLLVKVRVVFELVVDVVEIDVSCRLVAALAKGGGVVLGRVLVCDLELGLLARSLLWNFGVGSLSRRFPRLEGPDVNPPGFDIGLHLQIENQDLRESSSPRSGAETDTHPTSASVPYGVVPAELAMVTGVPWAMIPEPTPLALGYMPLVVGTVCEGLAIAVFTLKRLALMHASHMAEEGGIGRESAWALLASKGLLVVVVADHVEGGRGFKKREVKVGRVLFQFSLSCCSTWEPRRDLPMVLVLLLSRSACSWKRVYWKRMSGCECLEGWSSVL